MRFCRDSVNGGPRMRLQVTVATPLVSTSGSSPTRPTPGRHGMYTTAAVGSTVVYGRDGAILIHPRCCSTAVDALWTCSSTHVDIM